MRDSLQKLTKQIQPVINWVRRYKSFIFLVVLVLVYGFLVFKISALNSQEPSDDDVTAKLETVPRPRIDQNAVDKINELQDNSSQVKALFKHARTNPFHE